MYKKLLIAVFIAIASITNAVLAGEYTGDINTGIDTGIGGVVIKSPTASPGAGTYSSSVSVSLSAEGSVYMCYTSNSTTPTCDWTNLSCLNGTKYSSVITFTSSATLQAVSCYPGGDYSGTSSYQYIVTQPSSGGGGGGGSSPGTCLVYHLECRDGVYYRKVGVSCNGGELGQACTITDSGTSGGSGGVGLEDIWIDDIRANIYPLAQEKHKPIIDIMLNLFSAEITNDLEFARFQDDVRRAKNEYLRLFNDILVNIFKYVETKDQLYRTKAIDLIRKMIATRDALLDVKLKYVKIVNDIYKPVDEKYGVLFQYVEDILFKKINSLNLSEEQYQEFLDSYNSFVYSILVFKFEKSQEAKEFAKKQIVTILKYYYMN